MSQTSKIPEATEPGEAGNAAQLFPLVYDELRRLAARRMSQEAAGHTLQPTALVHEAWLRLTKPGDKVRFQNRAHFFGSVAEAMRRILIESARRKKRIRHGGHLEWVDLDAVEVALPLPPDELLALDEALDRLMTVDRRAAEVVKLHFFVGLKQEKVAEELGMSLRTVERLWRFARAWLFREVTKAAGGEP